MKKLVSLFLCLILLMGMLPLAAPARAASSGDWEYEIVDSKATITKYTGAGGSVTIPSTLGGKSVSVIGDYAFQNCTGLTAVTVPKSVTRMKYGAFSGCAELERVNITDLEAWCAIQFLESDANPLRYAHVLYLNGKAVTKLTIPSGVTSISDYAFYDCSTLKSVVIPEGVVSIGSYAFSRCTGLTSVTIPEGVTGIGYGAFLACTGLAGVTIPNSVTSIDNLAFSGCSSLTGVTIPNHVTSIGEGAFSGCTSLASVTIPDNITAIGNSTFSRCTSLTSVTIPEGVTSIGNEAFSGCYRLTGVTIPKSVTSIGQEAFNNCSRLTSIRIPSGVKSIGDNAFSECGLTSVTIPKSVKTMGSCVFQSMDGYLISAGPTGSSCDIRYGWTTSIPKNAFSGCYYLRTAVIPATVTEIRENAFANCSALGRVYFGGTAEQWEEVLLFGGNEALQSAKLFFGYQTGDPIIIDFGSCGDNLTWTLDNNGKLTISGTGRMTDHAFESYYAPGKIRSVVLNGGVTYIGEYAFSGCSSMTSITIPDSVLDIGWNAFEGCGSLTSVTIPNRVTGIGNGTFSGCTGLTSVTIPNNVTNIDFYAFSGCSSLTSVTIPKSVTWIDMYAFFGCSNLADVYYGGTAEDWAMIGIYSGNEPLTSANIHFTEPLVISSIKANKTGAAPGTAITWTAAASGGSGTLQYAFRVYKDGEILQRGTYAKAKTFTYTPAEVGTYKVRVYVKDAAGTVVAKTSSGVAIATPPIVTTQPSAKTVAAGTTAAFKVVASGTGLAYQWQYSKDGGTTWYNKSGATASSYTVTVKTSYDGFLYRCRVKNAGGTVYSNTAKLTVTVAKPVITTQPVAATVVAGANATFKITASGTGLTYQWQFSSDNGETWHNKSGATSSNYTVTAKTSYNGMLYRCRVKNAGGTVYSNTAKLTVASSAAPVISSVKANKTNTVVNDAITWSASAVGGTGTLQYYFIVYLDGIKVKTRAYSTASTFTYAPEEPGTYRVRVYVKDANDAKANKLSSGIAVTDPSLIDAGNYCLFDAVRVDTDSWGEPVYYAQVIMGDGTVKSLPISQATYASGLVNTVYKLTLYGSQYLFTPADATEMSFENYNANDGFTDYSGATFILYSGTKSSLTVAVTAKRPKANSAVYILYATERTGTIYTRRVKAVWFQTTASSDTPVSSNNIIYTTGAMQGAALINGSPVYYYEGYMNGAPMADLAIATTPAPGFYYAGKNASTGLYTLNAVPNGDGSKTGVRTFTLVNNIDQTITYDSGIGNGVLYLRDSAGNMRTMSLAGVAVIPVGEAAYSMYPINSVSALQNAVVGNQKVTVTLVEVVSGSNHSVGGNAIYVTAITQ